jgi:hypothetical protein
MYRCEYCLQDFLVKLDACPGCIDRATEKRRAKCAKDRRLRYDPVGQIEDWEFWNVLRLYSCCPCCGKAWASTAMVARDHIVPLSRGGPNEMRNIQPLCQPCNLWKSDHIIHFDRYFPGRCAPLSEDLIAHLPDVIQAESEQLSLMPAEPVDPSLRFPGASPRQLEAITLDLTREAAQ